MEKEPPTTSGLAHRRPEARTIPQRGACHHDNAGRESTKGEGRIDISKRLGVTVCDMHMPCCLFGTPGRAVPRRAAVPWLSRGEAPAVGLGCNAALRLLGRG